MPPRTEKTNPLSGEAATEPSQATKTTENVQKKPKKPTLLQRILGKFRRRPRQDAAVEIAAIEAEQPQAAIEIDEKDGGGGDVADGREESGESLPGDYASVVQEMQRRIDQLQEINAFLQSRAAEKRSETERVKRHMDRLQAQLWHCRAQLSSRTGQPNISALNSEHGPLLCNQPFWRRLMEALPAETAGDTDQGEQHSERR